MISKTSVALYAEVSLIESKLEANDKFNNIMCHYKNHFQFSVRTEMKKMHPGIYEAEQQKQLMSISDTTKQKKMVIVKIRQVWEIDLYLN